MADILDKFTKAELRRILRGDLKNQYGDEYDAHIKMLDNQKKGIQSLTKKMVLSLMNTRVFVSKSADDYLGVKNLTKAQNLVALLAELSRSWW